MQASFAPSDRPDLDALVADIQRELRLQDWRIKAAYIRDLCDEAGAPVYGLCSRLVDNKTAEILIRDPETPPPVGAPAKSPLEVLLHELTHLHFAPFGADTKTAIAAEEQAVWPIAEALYRHWGTPAAAMIARAVASASGNRQQMIARAMAARAEVRRQGMDLKMLFAALSAAAEADGLKPDSGTCKAIAAMREAIDGGGGEAAPPSEKKEPPPAARAAEAPPVEKKEPPPAEQRAQRATEALTLPVVLRALDERTEKTRLLELNKDRLGDKRYARLGTSAYSLAQVREEIEDLPPKPAPAGTAGDDGGPVPHASAKPRPWRMALKSNEAYLAARVRVALGVTEADEAAFDKRVDDDGGITISIVEITQQQAAARRAGKAVAA